MKKISAILLMLVFAFNLVGYRSVFYLAQKAADNEIEAYLDHNNFNEKDLLEISAPINLPYHSIDSSFERIDGEINIRGTIYKYVKRRIYDGKITVLCLPDYQKTNLESAKIEYSKNNLVQEQNSTNSKSPSAKLNLSKLIDSNFECNQIADTDLAKKRLPQKSFGLFICNWLSMTLPTPEQPPEII